MPTRNQIAKGSPGRTATDARRGGRLKHSDAGHGAAVKALRQTKATIVDSIAAGHSLTRAAGLAGVHRSTAYEWRMDDPEFRAALYEAAEARADVGEDLLWDHARSQHPGAVTAAIVINKQSGRFVDRQQIDSRSVTVSASVDLSHLTDQQLEDLLSLQSGRRQALESPKLEG